MEGILPSLVPIGAFFSRTWHVRLQRVNESLVKFFRGEGKMPSPRRKAPQIGDLISGSIGKAGCRPSE